ncbi:MAG: hypothetical protein H6724_11405 [Sandaracinus sp.]|nr:hypothetical protein [Sandaracinus sp.]
MSEKLDGVRAYLADGEHFVSRLGNRFFAPDWFVEKLPKTPSSTGFLFGGPQTLSAHGRHREVARDGGELWKDLRRCFSATLRAARRGRLRSRASSTAATSRPRSVRRPLAWHELRGLSRRRRGLREELARVEALGGEGLNMRRPKSRYEATHASRGLTNVKTFFDAEATSWSVTQPFARHDTKGVSARWCSSST